MMTTVVTLFVGLLLQTTANEGQECEIKDMRALTLLVEQLKGELQDYKERTSALEYILHTMNVLTQAEIREIRATLDKCLTDVKVLNESNAEFKAELNSFRNASKIQADMFKSTLETKVSDLNGSLSYNTGHLQYKLDKLSSFIRDEMHQLNATIETGLNDLRASQEYRIGDQGNRIQELKNVTTAQISGINRTMETRIQEATERMHRMNVSLQNQVATLETLSSMQALEKAVGFLAVSNRSQFICDGTLPFETAILNIGDVYNSSAGYFTAPYTAMFMFSVQVCLQRRSGVQFKITSPTRGDFSQTYDRDLTTDTCSSVTTIAYLSEGEQVYVHCTSLGYLGGTNENRTYWTMFSGASLD